MFQFLKSINQFGCVNITLKTKFLHALAVHHLILPKNCVFHYCHPAIICLFFYPVNVNVCVFMCIYVDSLQKYTNHTSNEWRKWMEKKLLHLTKVNAVEKLSVVFNGCKTVQSTDIIPNVSRNDEVEHRACECV